MSRASRCQSCQTCVQRARSGPAMLARASSTTLRCRRATATARTAPAGAHRSASQRHRPGAPRDTAPTGRARAVSRPVRSPAGAHPRQRRRRSALRRHASRAASWSPIAVASYTSNAAPVRQAAAAISPRRLGRSLAKCNRVCPGRHSPRIRVRTSVRSLEASTAATISNPEALLSSTKA